MKAIRTLTLVGCLFFSVLIYFSCKKADVLTVAKAEELQAQTVNQAIGARPGGAVLASSVNLTAPSVVNVNQQFAISAEITCGRVAIERGYILAADGSKIYKNLTCDSDGLEWEELVLFQCYTNDANWTGTLNEAGTYVYRTKHNAADGNCDRLGGNDKTGECNNGDNGNEFNCFVIEAVAGCETSFTGETGSCGS